jgi:ribose transport system permease protein
MRPAEGERVKSDMPADPPSPQPSHEPARRRLGFGQIASRYGLLSLALVLVVVFSLLLPRTFPTSTTALAIVDAQAVIAMLALAETIVVIVGEFDLSVGYLIGLSHILVLGFIVKSGMPWGLAVVLVVAIGLFVGLVNGLLVHVAKIDSFIATLGLGTILYSISNWYTSSQQVTGKLPRGFLKIYSNKPLGIPVLGIYVLVLLLVLWVVLEFTPTGRYLYALGGNRRAAELTGISSRRYVIGAFMASGAIVAVAGVVLASRLQIADVGNGPDYLLPTFVGAMLGSTTIKPGRPNPAGTIVAVLVLGIGIAGFQQIGGSTYFIVPLFNGTTLVVGVGLAGYASRRVRRVRRQATNAGDEIDAPSDSADS